jgi:hypothetical protein
VVTASKPSRHPDRDLQERALLEKFIRSQAPDYAADVSTHLKRSGWAKIGTMSGLAYFPISITTRSFSIDYVTKRSSRDFEIVALQVAATLADSRQDVVVLRQR